MRASEVCREWYRASNDDRAWAVVYKPEPVLAAMHRQTRNMHSRKQLYAQQVKSLKAAKAELVLPRDEYRLAVEIFRCGDPSTAIAASLHELPAAGRGVSLPRDVLDFELDPPIDIEEGGTGEERDAVVASSELRVKLFLVRKQDSKRRLLADCMTHERDGDVVLGTGALVKPDPHFFHLCYIDYRLQLQEVEESFDLAAPHTRKAESFRFTIDEGDWAGDPLVLNFETVLQMVQCPAFADCWN